MEKIAKILSLSKGEYILNNLGDVFINPATQGFYYNVSATADGFNAKAKVWREIVWAVETSSEKLCEYPRISIRDFEFSGSLDRTHIPGFSILTNGKLSKTVYCNSSESGMEECAKELLFVDITDEIRSDKASEIKTDVLYECNVGSGDIDIELEGCLEKFAIDLSCFLTNEEVAEPSEEQVCVVRSLPPPLSYTCRLGRIDNARALGTPHNTVRVHFVQSPYVGKREFHRENDGIYSPIPSPHLHLGCW